MSSKFKNFIYIFLLFLVFSGIGFVIGFVIASSANDFTTLHWILVFIIFIIGYYITIAIHELGHLVFGLLTGYKFLSYRFMSIMIQKDKEGKCKLKKYNIYGTGGQCIMIPPKDKDIPIFWYNFGGVCFNVLVSVIAGLLILLSTHILLTVFLIVLIAINLIIAILNWAPFSGLSNDGANYREIKNNELSKKAFQYVLETQKELAHGSRVSELDFGDFIFNELDFNLNLQANLGILFSLQALYQNDFDLWKERLMKIKESSSNNKLINLLLKPYLYLVSLIYNQNMEKDKETKLIIDKMKYEPIYQLIKLFESFKLNDKIDAKDERKFVKLCLNTPSPGEGKDALDLKDVLFKMNEASDLN